MSTSRRFTQRHDELRSGFRRLHQEMPGVTEAFFDSHKQSLAPGALSSAHKELIALAIGIAGHCDGCIAFHVHDALKAGASHDEIVETIGVAVMMGGGPSMVFGSDALSALDEFEAERTTGSTSV